MKIILALVFIPMLNFAQGFMADEFYLNTSPTEVTNFPEFNSSYGIDFSSLNIVFRNSFDPSNPEESGSESIGGVNSTSTPVADGLLVMLFFVLIYILHKYVLYDKKY